MTDRKHESPGVTTEAPAEYPSPLSVPPVDVVWEYTVEDFQHGGLRLHPPGALVRLKLPRRRLTLREMDTAASLGFRAGRVQVVGCTSDVAELAAAVKRKCADLDRAEREAASLADARLAEWRRIRDYCHQQGDTYRAGWWNERIARAEGDLYVAEEPGPMLRSVGGVA